MTPREPSSAAANYGMLAAMSRPILDEQRTHPAIRPAIDANHRDVIDEVEAAVASHDIVVVGMRQNPYPRRARKMLADKDIPFHYLEYGSYLSTWRRRNALKMWSGWPTFPMVFVKGVLIGGADDLERLLASGDLERMLGR